MDQRHRTLQAHDIERVYIDENGQDVLALQDFDLDIDGGQIVSLVGPSGCGKSTFLRLLAGLDEPQKGSLLYNGEPIEGTSIDRGFVFQDPTLFMWLSVFDNVAFGPKMNHRLAQTKERIHSIIEAMGLEYFKNSYPYQLSGGMQSRTALARTFVMEPGLVLLDEPLSALDAFTRASIQDQIVGMWESYRPIIVLVTHDIEEAVYLSDRIVVVSERPGHVIGEVAIDLERPRHRTSSEFVALRQKVIDIMGGGAKL